MTFGLLGSMGYPVTPLREAVERAFPNVRNLGVYNRRYIAGTTTWSQHAWGAAWDIRPPISDKHQIVEGYKSNPITKNTLDEVYTWLVREKAKGTTFGGYKVGTILWRVKAHYNHIHVELAPKQTGTPPKSISIGDALAAMEVEDVQRALVEAGFDLGTYGPNNDGVDGDWGSKSHAALVKALSPQEITQGVDAHARKRIQAVEGRLGNAKVVI